MTKWKPYETRIDKNAGKNSKSEKKQVCSNGLKRLDSNTEIFECEEHNHLQNTLPETPEWKYFPTSFMKKAQSEPKRNETDGKL